MESIRQVESELKRSEVKFSDFQRQSINILDHAVQLAQQVKEEVEQLNGDNTLDSNATAVAQQRVQEKLNSIKKLCKDYGEAHRDIHPTVSRIGRVIDKYFTSDLRLFAEPSQALTSLDVVDNEAETPAHSFQSVARQLLQQYHQAAAASTAAQSNSALGLEAVSVLLQQLGGGGHHFAFGTANVAADFDLPLPAHELYGYGGSSAAAALASSYRREAEEASQNVPTPPVAPALTSAEEERIKEANNERKQTALCEALVQHFYRQGMMDVGDELCRDAKLNVSSIQRERYVELNSILNKLRQADLQPALEWAELHADELNADGSLFELKLHRFRFIQLLASGKRSELLQYARVFGKFHQKEQLREVQTLMGNLIFVPKDLQAELNQFEATLQPVLINDLCDTFIRDACRLQHMPSEGPLDIALKVGCQAIEPLLDFHNVVGGGGDGSAARPGAGGAPASSSAIWDATRPELPVEIPGAREYSFHSVFVCPILRQPTSSKNPPMRLVCGHSISRDALNKLTSHMSSVSRFKCPYCPKEQDPKEAKQIRF